MGTVAQCWVTNVASINAPGGECDYHIEINDSYACEIRECWFQGGGVKWFRAGLRVYLVNNVSDVLVEDVSIFSGEAGQALLSSLPGGEQSRLTDIIIQPAI